MKRVAQANTAPEREVRRLLTLLGARYRLNVRSLPGRPDIGNSSRRKAIFVHGCFWHAHPECPRGRLPASNVVFWTEKLLANRRRDSRNVRDLLALGYDVLVVWECELRDRSVLRSRLRRFWTRKVPPVSDTIALEEE